MEWADRQRFLQVVGPLRTFAIISAVTAGLGLLGLAGSTVNDFFYRRNGVIFSRDLLSLVTYVVVLYLQWLNWKFAGALAATAGGTTPSMQQWSSLHLRLVWISLLYLVLYYLEWTVQWGSFFLRRLSDL